VASYVRVRCIRAWGETSEYWNVHRHLAHFVPTGLGLIHAAIQMFLHSSKPPAEIALFGLVWAVGGTVGVYLVLLACSFLVNYIWKTPEALHAEQMAIIREQSKALVLTAYDQEQVNLVAQKMAMFSGEEAKVIELLLRTGEIQKKDSGKLGFFSDLLRETALTKGKQALLVKERVDRQPGGNVEYLSINPAFESALKYWASTRSQSHPRARVIPEQ
jgi:hypothetical protein